MADHIKTGAVISDCGKYRYRLDRRWSDGPTCVFIMLNPSTADHTQDDPTIRRCIGFAKREGCGALAVINVMAFRATKPKDLPRDFRIAAGPENSAHIRSVVAEADGPIVAAWGAHKGAAWAGGKVLAICKAAGRQVYSLKTTQSGSPGHPLYVKADAPLVPIFATGLGDGALGDGQ